MIYIQHNTYFIFDLDLKDILQCTYDIIQE